MMEYPFLFVALDSKSWGEARMMVEQLAPIKGNFGFKLNANLWFSYEPDKMMGLLKTLGKPVFADVKMFLGKRTMAWIAEDLVELGIDLINIHLFAGIEAVKAVSEVTQLSDTKLLGLTVPTHYDDYDCQKQFGKSLTSMVVQLASTATESGCDGIILPPSTLCPLGWGNPYGEMLKVVPGIRVEGLPGFDDKRHAKPVTPKKAIGDGADILVCGTPITKSEDKVRALQKVLAEMI